MGRTSGDGILEYYIISQDKKKATCIFSDCSVSLAFIVGNLKRHLVAVHNLEFSQSNGSGSGSGTIKKKKTITITMDAKTLSSACLQMITKDALPVRVIDSGGFREIIDPISHALGISITASNINKIIVNEAAVAIKNIIKTELCDKVFSLKIDTAARYGRTILGINAQFIHNDKIQVRTLAMVDTKKKLSAKILKHEIEKVLLSYQCTIKQICSITSDNSANMVKCTNLLKNEQNTLVINNYQVKQIVESDDEEVNDLSLNNLTVHGPLRCIRCASYTLQLSVHDALVPYVDELLAIRNIIKKIRKDQIKRILVLRNIAIPPLDVPSKWNTTFLMISSLFTNKDIFKSVSNIVEITDELWIFIEIFYNTFKPVFECALELQAKDITIGDCVVSWLKLKMKLSEISDKMCSKMLIAMENHQPTLINNDVVRAALFIDQRFNFIGSDSVYLSSDAKMEAEKYLFNLYEVIQEQDSSIEHKTVKELIQPSNVLKDDLDLFYNSVLGIDETNVSNLSLQNIKQQISDLRNRPRVSLTSNAMDQWKLRRITYPYLYKLAITMLAVPSSQVSDEGASSALQVVLNNKRTNVNAALLENILIIKFNYSLMNSINI